MNMGSLITRKLPPGKRYWEMILENCIFDFHIQICTVYSLSCRVVMVTYNATNNTQSRYKIVFMGKKKLKTRSSKVHAIPGPLNYSKAHSWH